MSDAQFRRIRSKKSPKVKKGSPSKTFRLAQAVRAVQDTTQEDRLIGGLLKDITQVVETFCLNIEPGKDKTCDAIRKGIEEDPSWHPDLDQVFAVLGTAYLYARVNPMRSNNLRDRLVQQSNDHLPDSLEDPTWLDEREQS